MATTSPTITAFATNTIQNALTTTFTPPADCLTRFAFIDAASSQIWRAPYAVGNVNGPASCHPQEWIQARETAALNELVCPDSFTLYPLYFTAPPNYKVCCPSGYAGLRLAESPPADRPASGAACYSPIPFEGLLVTHYPAGGTDPPATSTWKPQTTDPETMSTWLYAHAYDGFSATIPTGLPNVVTEATGDVSIPAITPFPSSVTTGPSSAAEGRNSRTTMRVLISIIVGVTVLSSMF